MEGWKVQNMPLKGVFIDECYFSTNKGSTYSKEFKPYLRPLSSMTEEERKEYNSFFGGIEPYDCDFSAYPIEYKYVYEWDIKNYIDFLNANHFDYRGLIPKGLAIEVTKENNPYEEINM